MASEVKVDITEEMKSSYIDYAMSVIVGRALPDVRDGLKPVHRRILYAMHEQGVSFDQSPKKSARIVGDVMGKYHPHGDAAIYETMVRMAQDFSMRYPLVDGQGNFGSIDGDPAAAMRYTEVKLSKIAGEMLADISKNTVDFVPNYDDSLKEPSVLPAVLPNLLLNGSTGIAVGMATNIPPHNLREVAGAIIRLIDYPDLTPEELMESIPGPDFPTGGYIIGKEGIESTYHTGRGIIKIRAKSVIEEDGRTKIIFTELPYQVNKAKVLENIAELVKTERIDGISDLRDESDNRDGIRMVVELKNGASPQVVLNQLHKHTQLDTSYGIINLVLVDGEPRTLPLKDMLEHYILYRKEVIERRTQFDLDRAEKRAHLLAGLIIALQNIDEVIKSIKAAPSPKEAKTSLIDAFDLSEEQAKAILDMRLQRLTALEQEKIENEAKELEITIAELREILASAQKVLAIIKSELTELSKKYGDSRRTQIIDAENFNPEDLIQEEEIAVTITSDGYIKRQPLTAYRMQRRGGKGVMGSDTKSEDFVTDLFIASTLDYLLFFTDKGKAYWLKVFDVPAMGRTARGKAIVNLLQLEEDEKVTEAVAVNSFESDEFIVMFTQCGNIVKIPLKAFSHPRKTGIKAVNLRNDRLVAARVIDGGRELLVATRLGKAIRFHETDVRPSNRGAMGVKAITLGKGDEVISMDVFSPETSLLTVTSRGYGKRTELDEYPLQRRGGKGVRNISTKKGEVVDTRTVLEDDELMLTTKEGVVIRVPAKEIRVQGRATQGVRIMNVKPKDEVAAVARIR